MRYEKFRREYTAGGLSRESLDACAVSQFQKWLRQAIDAQIGDPTAMVLATVDASGSLGQRIVLLKDVRDGCFVFYTNYQSDKSRAMASEPRVSLLFPWQALDRQVIVSGHVRKIDREESAAYFQTRPRESQIAAWASHQSQPIENREALEQQAELVRARFTDIDIPLPDFWGGYEVVPAEIEFWQGGANRLHDRFRYTAVGPDEWRIEQLQP